MRQSLLLLAAAASAQTRITNWEEQHQRFVRQAAFEDLLSWFRQRCVDAGGFVVPGLSQRPGGIRNVFLPSGAKSGDALLRIPRQCLLDGWRALAKGASLTPDAEVVRVRVQTKEPNLKLGWLHGNETCVDRHESCGPWSVLGECKNNPTWMRPHCPVSCKVVQGCTSSKPRILVEDVSTETWTSVKAVVGDLLLALRGDEVLFVREVDGPADVTVVAS